MLGKSVNVLLRVSEKKYLKKNICIGIGLQNPLLVGL